MDFLLALLARYKYAAMFGILVLCGLGLPVPEEATLLFSGLMVGWGWADFWLSSMACVLGILAGDTLIFALGHFYGRRFLETRLMRWALTKKRQRKIGETFAKHGAKAVFFARFFAGIRIGVYAYAGQHGMNFFRFLLLDFLGAMISGPTSIWLGKFAAETIANREDAKDFAEKALRTGHHWIYALLAAGALVILLCWIWKRRQAARRPGVGPVDAARQVPQAQAPGAIAPRPPRGPGAPRPPEEAGTGEEAPPRGKESEDETALTGIKEGGA